MKRKEKGCRECDLMSLIGKKSKIKKKERIEEFVSSQGCRIAFSAIDEAVGTFSSHR